MTTRWLAILILLTACKQTEPVPVEEDTQIGACGEPEEGFDVTVTGLVLDHNGDPAALADVTLEERNWNTNTTVHGTTATDEAGAFSIDATNLVSVPGCWGTVVDYWVVAELDGGWGEAQANQRLFNAIDDGSLTADFTSFPIDLTAPDSGL